MNFRTAITGFVMLASVAGCNGSSTGVSGDAGGQQGGSGNQAGGPVGAVTLGPGIRFVSSHNGTQNPAVDTIPVGGAVTWTWTGSLPHGVQSLGATGFSTSDIKTGSGTYSVTFTEPGTYQYDCIVHGTAMKGTIIVR
jgi:plastocyanin